MIFYRNTIPSRDSFSVIDRNTEIQWFSCVFLIFIIRFLENGTKDKTTTRAIIELLILLLFLVKLKLNIIFWEKKLNEMMTYGVCVLVACTASWLLMQATSETVSDGKRSIV